MLLWRSRTAVGGPMVWRLAAGLLLSRTGDQLTTIALLWLVLDLTGRGRPWGWSCSAPGRRRWSPGRGSAARAALGDPTVRVVLAVTLAYFLAYGPLEPALPLYSRDVLHAGPSGYGLLWSAFGAGALLALAVGGLIWAPYVAIESTLLQRLVPAPCSAGCSASAGR